MTDNEIAVAEFKHFINKNFTEMQITNILEMLHMYIELVGNEEMKTRIYSQKIDDTIETKLRGVAEFADVFNNFLKNSGQK